MAQYAMQRGPAAKRFVQRAADLHARIADEADGLCDAVARRRFAWSLLSRAMLWGFAATREGVATERFALGNDAGSGGGLYRRTILPLLDESTSCTSTPDNGAGAVRNVYRRWAGSVFETSLSEAFPDVDLPNATAAALEEFVGAQPWRTATAGSSSKCNAISPLLEPLLARLIDRRRVGAYYTGDDVADYMTTRAVLPSLLRRVAQLRPEAEYSWTHWLRHNAAACASDGEGFFDAPTLSAADLVSRNIDLPRLAAEWLIEDGVPFRATVAKLLDGDSDAEPLSVLDPTCGAGAFLLAALRTLEPLYDICGVAHGSHAAAAILARHLHGVDLLPEAVETCRLRLLLEWLAATPRGAATEPPDLRRTIRRGDALLRDDRPTNDREAGEAVADDFGWSEAFPGVFRRGGFDVVVGNPPYVESPRNGAAHPLRGVWRTRACGNLHALVSERSAELLRDEGAFCFVVPAASVCTPRMRPLVDLLQRRYARLWISLYDERPGKLFPGVDQQLAIVLGHGGGPCRELFITPMRHWTTRPEDERRLLFTSLRYQRVPAELRVAEVIPKVGSSLELAMIGQLSSLPSQAWRAGRSDADAAPVFYKNAGGRYWRLVKSFPTAYASQRGARRTSTELALFVRRPLVPVVVCVLSSSLFYWFWRVVSNCRHLTERELSAFPLPPSLASPESLRQFAELGARYEQRLRETRVRKTTNNARSGRIVQDEFRVSKAKPILDEIDAALAPHYGLSDQQRDFVIGYDLRYRLAGSRSQPTTRPAPATSPPRHAAPAPDGSRAD